MCLDSITVNRLIDVKRCMCILINDPLKSLLASSDWIIYRIDLQKLDEYQYTTEYRRGHFSIKY